MPIVWIPSLLHPLTQGQEKIHLPGETLRQVIEHLEERFPGIQERLCEGERLRPSMVAVVDGVVSRQGLRHKLRKRNSLLASYQWGKPLDVTPSLLVE